MTRDRASLGTVLPDPGVPIAASPDPGNDLKGLRK
jgi:hypothetical protein